MTTLTHTPGTFCWWDLATTDAEAATAFYTTLFGWTAEATRDGHGRPYRLLRCDGALVGGLYALTPEMEGAPVAWTPFVAVASADAAARAARAHGGGVLLAPCDVDDAGRMAIVQDPSGGVLALWQAGRHAGAERLEQTGAPCWVELNTRDAAAAGAFYKGLFGWHLETMEIGGMPYTVFVRDDQAAMSGMLQMDAAWGEAPTHWMTYFQVDDCDAAAHRAAALGGQVCVPPTDAAGIGRFAVLGDPQGAFFSVIRPEREA